MTERTRFVVPVHLYGQMADMRRLREIAAAQDFTVIEDAAQAHGAERDGLRAGAAGTAAAFSFYPSKNLGAAGDAGALVTDDDAIAERARALRHHGELQKYRSAFEGYTARLDTVQAIVLLHKLPRLDAWIAERRAAARFYSVALEGVGDLRLPPVAEGSDPVWHLYVVRTDDPEELARHLDTRGIGTGRHYPEPPHLSEAFAWLGHGPGSFPVTERIAREALSIPLFPGISELQLTAVDRGDCRLLWLTGRQTRPPIASSPTSSSATAWSSSSSQTCTGAASAPRRASGRSSRFSPERSSARAARSRATPSSAPASRSETASSSGTA